MRLLSLLIFSFLFFTAEIKAQIVHLNEDFNSATLPTGWTNSAVTGTQSWSFGIDAAVGSGNFSSFTQNIDGTALAFFDDDALGANSSNTVELTTPAFDNSANSTSFLEFDYNFKEYLGIADSFFVDVYDGSNWIRVFSVNTDDCGHYKNCSSFPHARIDISAYANSSCQIRFTYYDDNDWGWYVGLDNVFIYSPYPNDIGIASIQPFTTYCSTSDSLKISIVNYGTSTASNFPLSYRLNGSPSASSTFNGSISPQDTASFTFPNLINFQTGQNLIEVYTLMAIDQDNNNDTTSISYNLSNNYSLPYFEDFEGNSQDWTSSGTNSSWQIGQPNGTIINSAASGTQSAVTNLNGSHNNNERSYLNSPCIFLGPSTTDIKLSFDYWSVLENSFDNCWLEYTTDGTNWVRVSRNSNYPNINWYNNSSGQTWTGLSASSYSKASVVMQGLPQNSTIRFRFVLFSDGTTNLEGFAVDNFNVSVLSQVDLGLIEIKDPGSTPLCRISLTSPTLRISNLGINPITSANFFYQVNNGPVYNDTLRSTLLPGEVRDYQFSQSYNFNNLNQFNLRIWSSTPSDTLNLNDSLVGQFNNNLPSTVYQVPYNEGFGGVPFGGQASTNWTTPNNHNGAFGWRLRQNDFLYHDANGDGTYAELFTTRLNYNYSLVSPCIDLDTMDKPVLQFAFLNERPANDEFYVQINNGGQWITLDTIIEATNFSMSTLNHWKYHSIPLKGYENNTIKIRFIAFLNPFPRKIAVDDVRIIDPNTDALRMNSIILDSASCALGAQASIKVRFREFIADTLRKDSLSFELYLNGALLSSENFQFDLYELRGDTSFVFNQKVFLNQTSPQQIKVISKLNYNGQLQLDSIEKTIQITYDQLPYFEGFETSFINCFENIFLAEKFDQSSGWTFEQNNLWHVTDTSQCSYNYAYGAGTFTPGTGPMGPQEGNAFIYTDIQSDDSSNYLFSPCFDLSNYNQAEVEYYYHRNFSLSIGDMGVLRLEVNHNNNWILIDRVDTTWNNANSPWQKRSIDISSYLGSTIQFRFSVDSSLFNYTVPPNTAIDAFKIFDPLAVGIEESQSGTHTLSVYPNPSNGQFSIEVPNNLIGERYEIVDLSGKVIQSARFNRTLEQIQFESDKGVYILRVPGSGVVEKIVVY